MSLEKDKHQKRENLQVFFSCPGSQSVLENQKTDTKKRPTETQKSLNGPFFCPPIWEDTTNLLQDKIDNKIFTVV